VTMTYFLCLLQLNSTWRTFVPGYIKINLCVEVLFANEWLILLFDLCDLDLYQQETNFSIFICSFSSGDIDLYFVRDNSTFVLSYIKIHQCI
jgi:hypothetical protein